MNQLALLDRMDEFFALGLGLHGSKHPNKKPGRQLLRFRAGCFYAIQGRPGAQVALLQSLVSLTVMICSTKPPRNARNKRTH
jgi:hypothetical protein